MTYREMNLKKNHKLVRCAALTAGAVSLVLSPLAVQGLTLDEAVREGMARNGALFQRLTEARQAAAALVQVEGVYDTELGVNLYYTDSELSQAGSPIDSASKTTHGDAFLRRRFASGTSAEAALTSDHVRFANTMFGDESNQTVASLTLSQSLLRDSFGRQNEAVIEAARARYQSAWLRYLDERDAVALEIHRAFWSAYSEFSTLQILQRSLTRAEELLDVNRQREKDGLLDETDVLAAEAALATRTVDVIAQQDAYINRREELLVLIRLPMAVWDDTRLDYAPSLRASRQGLHLNAWDLYRDARASRELFKALESDLEAAELDVEAAEERVEPELNLYGSVGVGDTDDDYPASWNTGRTRWTIGLEFRTTWDKRAERSLLEQARLQADRIRDQIAQAEQELFYACRSSTRDLATLESRLEAAKLAGDLHRRKLDLETKKFEQGRSETSRIVDYQDDVEEAEGAVTRADAYYRIRAAENVRLQGTLSGAPPQPLDPDEVVQ